ncbi:uncharacterized protein LOC130713718 [Lotus japonicus]|uniref:uncharacterized protein LOC130713718 n=1 Tax=Lotus japonicus TaxID=34305 RepID=UPI0025834133|nr:uncharacterized protein LOC130713718 [Lotus japonicus]
MEHEDHLFLLFPTTKRVWFASQIGVRGDSFPPFREFWRAVIQLGDDEVVAMAQSIVYALWEARNQKCFQQREVTTEAVLGRARGLMEEVQVRDQASAPAVAFPARWRRPGPGIIKCNFDAYFLVDGPAVMGMVARNSEGEVMAASCSYPLSIISPLLAEAVSMRWTMQLAIDLGFRRILLETDCLQLFKAWKAKEPVDHILVLLFQIVVY